MADSVEEFKSEVTQRVTKQVNKVAGLLPVEWTNDLRTEMTSLAIDSYKAGLREAEKLANETIREVWGNPHA